MKRISRRPKLFLLTGIISAGAIALASCSSSSSSAGSSASASAKPGKVTLVVYSAQGYDHAMTTAFTKATGIPVKLDDNSTGPLLTQIEASRNPAALMAGLSGDAGVVLLAIGEHLVHVRLGPHLDAAHHLLE
jgi:iron(III) transport system substrate-binding protein